MENVCDRATAVAEFERWADFSDIDLAPEGIDENERGGFERDRMVVIRAIEKGRAIVDEEGQITVVCKHSEDRITFHIPEGSAYIVMDKKKRSSDFGKLFASLGSMTNTAPVRFAKIKQPDLKICIAIWSLFLV